MSKQPAMEKQRVPEELPLPENLQAFTVATKKIFSSVTVATGWGGGLFIKQISKVTRHVL